MASESHARPDAAARHERPDPPAERRGPQYTHEMVMTTRGKRQLMVPYPAEVEVEAGQCTVDTTDPTRIYVVSSDKPGESRVSVTPLEPNDDYLPAVIRVTVHAPATVIEMGDEESK